MMNMFDRAIDRASRLRWQLATTVAVLLFAAVPVPNQTAIAQEMSCDQEGDLPCGFGIMQMEMSRPPSLFNLQARVSKAQLPLGAPPAMLVVVKLLRGTEVLCMEQIANVNIADSILNLTIGQNMSCRLDDALAENVDLALQICIGGPTNCLKPVELGGVPFAVKATYAGLAQHSFRADAAGVANYALRATADRDMLMRKTVGAGYFSFATPGQSKAAGIYPNQDEFTPYKFGGFIQWTPYRDEEANRVHLVAKDGGTDALIMLEEVVLVAHKTTLSGDVLIQPAAEGTGLRVLSGGLAVTGQTEFKDDLHVIGLSDVFGPLAVAGPTEVNGKLTIQASGKVLSGGLDVTGATIIDGALLLTGPLDVQGGLTGDMGAEVNGLLTAQSGSVSAALNVGGQSTLSNLEAGELNVQQPMTLPGLISTGTATLGGDLPVGGSLVVEGPVVFHDHVVFAGGSGSPGEALDPLYLWAENEVRDLALGGPVAIAGGVTIGADVHMSGHQFRNTIYQSAAAAPFPCDAAHQGAFYVDTTDESLTYCLDGEFKYVGKDDCGNGLVQPWEECDDGGLDNDDGCSSICTVEDGWICPSFNVQPTSGCAQIPEGCGDGVRAVTEPCDDGNNEAGDGCSPTCQVEAGWACAGGVGLQSDCTGQPCGDGLVEGTEECDDGGTAAGDGCDGNCQAESGWVCAGSAGCWQCGAVDGSHCYVAGSYVVDWATARDECILRGGYLARIESAAEEQKVLAAGCTAALGCWIGLSDAESEGDYRWVEESGGGTPVYLNWRAGQPTGEPQDCAVVNEEGWWDRDCTAVYGFVCEIPQ